MVFLELTCDTFRVVTDFKIPECSRLEEDRFFLCSVVLLTFKRKIRTSSEFWPKFYQALIEKIYYKHSVVDLNSDEFYEKLEQNILQIMSENCFADYNVFYTDGSFNEQYTFSYPFRLKFVSSCTTSRMKIFKNYLNHFGLRSSFIQDVSLISWCFAEIILMSDKKMILELCSSFIIESPTIFQSLIEKWKTNLFDDVLITPKLIHEDDDEKKNVLILTTSKVIGKHVGLCKVQYHSIVKDKLFLYFTLAASLESDCPHIDKFWLNFRASLLDNLQVSEGNSYKVSFIAESLPFLNIMHPCQISSERHKSSLINAMQNIDYIRILLPVVIVVLKDHYSLVNKYLESGMLNWYCCLKNRITAFPANFENIHKKELELFYFGLMVPGKYKSALGVQIYISALSNVSYQMDKMELWNIIKDVLHSKCDNTDLFWHQFCNRFRKKKRDVIRLFDRYMFLKAVTDVITDDDSVEPMPGLGELTLKITNAIYSIIFYRSYSLVLFTDNGMNITKILQQHLQNWNIGEQVENGDEPQSPTIQIIDVFSMNSITDTNVGTDTASSKKMQNVDDSIADTNHTVTASSKEMQNVDDSIADTNHTDTASLKEMQNVDDSIAETNHTDTASSKEMQNVDDDVIIIEPENRVNIDLTASEDEDSPELAVPEEEDSPGLTGNETLLQEPSDCVEVVVVAPENNCSEENETNQDDLEVNTRETSVTKPILWEANIDVDDLKIYSDPDIVETAQHFMEVVRDSSCKCYRNRRNDFCPWCISKVYGPFSLLFIKYTCYFCKYSCTGFCFLFRRNKEIVEMCKKCKLIQSVLTPKRSNNQIITKSEIKEYKAKRKISLRNLRALSSSCEVVVAPPTKSFAKKNQLIKSACTNSDLSTDSIVKNNNSLSDNVLVDDDESSSLECVPYSKNRFASQIMNTSGEKTNQASRTVNSLPCTQQIQTPRSRTIEKLGEDMSVVKTKTSIVDSSGSHILKHLLTKSVIAESTTPAATSNESAVVTTALQLQTPCLSTFKKLCGDVSVSKTKRSVIDSSSSHICNPHLMKYLVAETTTPAATLNESAVVTTALQLQTPRLTTIEKLDGDVSVLKTERSVIDSSSSHIFKPHLMKYLVAESTTSAATLNVSAAKTTEVTNCDVSVGSIMGDFNTTNQNEPTLEQNRVMNSENISNNPLNMLLLTATSDSLKSHSVEPHVVQSSESVSSTASTETLTSLAAPSNDSERRTTNQNTNDWVSSVQIEAVYSCDKMAQYTVAEEFTDKSGMEPVPLSISSVSIMNTNEGQEIEDSRIRTFWKNAQDNSNNGSSAAPSNERVRYLSIHETLCSWPMLTSPVDSDQDLGPGFSVIDARSNICIHRANDRCTVCVCKLCHTIKAEDLNMCNLCRRRFHKICILRFRLLISRIIRKFSISSGNKCCIACVIPIEPFIYMELKVPNNIPNKKTCKLKILDVNSINQKVDYLLKNSNEKTTATSDSTENCDGQQVAIRECSPQSDRNLVAANISGIHCEKQTFAQIENKGPEQLHEDESYITYTYDTVPVDDAVTDPRNNLEFATMVNEDNSNAIDLEEFYIKEYVDLENKCETFENDSANFVDPDTVENKFNPDSSCDFELNGNDQSQFDVVSEHIDGVVSPSTEVEHNVNNNVHPISEDESCIEGSKDQVPDDEGSILDTDNGAIKDSICPVSSNPSVDENKCNPDSSCDFELNGNDQSQFDIVSEHIDGIVSPSTEVEHNVNNNVHPVSEDESCIEDSRDQVPDDEGSILDTDNGAIKDSICPVSNNPSADSVAAFPYNEMQNIQDNLNQSLDDTSCAKDNVNSGMDKEYSAGSVPDDGIRSNDKCCSDSNYIINRIQKRGKLSKRKKNMKESFKINLNSPNEIKKNVNEKYKTKNEKDRPFGPIPGIRVGTCWKYRTQVSECGVHPPTVAGIYGNERNGARSIVLSGCYSEDHDMGNEFIYSGCGGRISSSKLRVSDQIFDQSLTRFNKGLALCCNCPFNEEGGEATNWRGGKPVRVIRNYKLGKMSPYAPAEGNRYDGIYKVVKYFPYRNNAGLLVWKFLMRRDDPEPAPWTDEGKELIKKYNLKMIVPETPVSAEEQAWPVMEETEQISKPRGRRSKEAAILKMKMESANNDVPETQVSAKKQTCPMMEKTEQISESRGRRSKEAVILKRKMQSTNNDFPKAAPKPRLVSVKEKTLPIQKETEIIVESRGRQSKEAAMLKMKINSESNDDVDRLITEADPEPPYKRSKLETWSPVNTVVEQKEVTVKPKRALESEKENTPREKDILRFTSKNVVPEGSFELGVSLKRMIANDYRNKDTWNYLMTNVKQDGLMFLNMVYSSFTCPECKTLARDPFTAPCKHNTCISCLMERFRSGNCRCPTCDSHFGCEIVFEKNNELSAILRMLFPKKQK